MTQQESELLNSIRQELARKLNYYGLEGRIEFDSSALQELGNLSAGNMQRASFYAGLAILDALKNQILGAEKALFRHLKTGAKPPRHGLIVNHPLIAKSPERMHGKIARALADKISIASKVDYFKGELIGDKLRKELEKKFA